MIDYAPLPVRNVGPTAWRSWYAKGKPGSFAGCVCLLGGLGGWLPFAIALIAHEVGSLMCLAVPIALVTVLAGFIGLLERDADKFFSLSGLALLAAEVLATTAVLRWG